MNSHFDPAGPKLKDADEAPKSLDKIASLVDNRIRALFDIEMSRWSGIDESLSRPLNDLLKFALAGGKRLRPAFCYWAYVATGGTEPDDGVVDGASALELLHCFALIHDDVMDQSPFRRGAPSLHSVYQSFHATMDYQGEATRFGDAAAILIGDLAFVYADRLLETAPLKARSIFTQLRLEVNFGQYLDVVGTARRSYDAQYAAKVAIYKSGKYTIERPLHLGAALAGAEDGFYDQLSAFGLPLGEAFQLRDDILGIFGDSNTTGKPVGDDLKEGKPTLLYALAMERASQVEKGVMEALFGRKDLDDQEILTLQEIFVSTGALASVENKIETLTEIALVGLSNGSFDPVAAIELGRLAEYVGHRRN